MAANVNSCVDTTAPEGHTYRYAVFAVDAAEQRIGRRRAGGRDDPDMTPPGAPAALSVKAKGLSIAMTWRLPTAADLLKIVIVKNATHSPKSPTDGKVVYTGKAAKASVGSSAASPPSTARSRIDRAGNASATAGVRIKQPVFKLFPENGSELRGTVRLTWKKPKRATLLQRPAVSRFDARHAVVAEERQLQDPALQAEEGQDVHVVRLARRRQEVGRPLRHMIGKSTFTYLG